MHRSASAARALDEHLARASVDRLPTYDPQSEAGKKAAQRARMAENMVHAIPLVLILCAVLLWFFSHPEIDMLNKDVPVIARMKNMTIDGYSNLTGASATMGVELDLVDEVSVGDTSRLGE